MCGAVSHFIKILRHLATGGVIFGSGVCLGVPPVSLVDLFQRTKGLTMWGSGRASAV